MSAPSLNARESRVLSHILQALDEWTDGAEDDGDADTLVAVEPLTDEVGPRCYCFRFSDGSTISARLDVVAP